MIRAFLVAIVGCSQGADLNVAALCGDDASIDAAIDTPAGGSPRRFIVIAGQSNAYGMGDSIAIPTSIAAPYPDVRLVQAISLDAGYHLATSHDGALQPRSDGKFGVELTLGRALPQYDIIEVGINGTSLWYNWKPTGPWPTTPNLYSQMVALAQGAAVGHDVAAFIWIQGESDAGNSTWANAYGAELTDLAARVHTAFPGALFVYDRLSSQTTFAYKAQIRAAQEAAMNGSGMAMVDVDDLGISGYHFTAQGLLDLGNRLGAVIGGI